MLTHQIRETFVWHVTLSTVSLPPLTIAYTKKFSKLSTCLSSYINGFGSTPIRNLLKWLHILPSEWGRGLYVLYAEKLATFRLIYDSTRKKSRSMINTTWTFFGDKLNSHNVMKFVHRCVELCVCLQVCSLYSASRKISEKVRMKKDIYSERRKWYPSRLNNKWLKESLAISSINIRTS